MPRIGAERGVGTQVNAMLRMRGPTFSPTASVGRKRISNFLVCCADGHRFIPPRKYLNQPRLPEPKRDAFFRDALETRKKSEADVDEREMLELFGKLATLNFWEDIDGLLNAWNGRFNRKNFLRLLTEVIKSGDWKKSMKIFTWMKAQRCYRAKTEYYNALIFLAARHRKLNKARFLFYEMQEWRCKPDIRTYNGLILAHGRFGDYRNAIKLLDTMLRNQIPPSTSTYNTIINACAESGKWKEAFSILDKMKSNGVYIDLVTHNTILSALKNGEEYLKAIEYFDNMKRKIIPCSPDIVSYAVVMSCLSKIQQYDRLYELFQELDSYKPYSPLHPNMIILNVLMHAYANQGRSKQAQEVFDRITGEGLTPCLISFNTLMEAYANAKDADNAQRVFESIWEYNLRPDIVSFTTLINAFAKSNQSEKAKDVFELMKRKLIKPNLLVFNSMIHAFSKQGNLAGAEEFRYQMEESGIHPSVVTFTSLISACRMTRQHAKAYRYFLESKVHEIKPNVFLYNSILHVLLECGEYEKAEEVLVDMRKENVKFDESTYGIMIEAMGKIGRIDEAKLLYEDLKKNDSLRMTSPIFSSLISAFAIKGSHKEARLIFDEMKELKVSPTIITCTSLLQAYSRAGLVKDAEAFFDQMQTEYDFEIDVIAYSLMMNMYNKFSLYNKSIALGEQFLSQQSKNVSSAFCTEYLSAAAKTAEWEKAYHLYEIVQSNSSTNPNENVFFPFHCNLLLDILTRAGKLNTAFKVFASMKDDHVLTLPSYNLLLRSFANDSRWRTCSKILEWMKEAGVKRNTETFNSILFSFSKHGLWRKALQLFEDMQKEGIFPDRSTYYALITTLRNGGQENLALEFQKEAKKMSSSAQVLDHPSPNLTLAHSFTDTEPKTIQIPTPDLPIHPKNDISGARDQQLARPCLEVEGPSHGPSENKDKPFGQQNLLHPEQMSAVVMGDIPVLVPSAAATAVPPASVPAAYEDDEIDDEGGKTRKVIPGVHKSIEGGEEPTPKKKTPSSPPDNNRLWEVLQKNLGNGFGFSPSSTVH